MTPEEFDIDFDFDKEYGYANNSGKHAADDDFDLDAALARELGADFDELFEKEYAAAQAALNAKSAPVKKPAAPETDDLDETRLFTDFSTFDDEAEEAAQQPVPGKLPETDDLSDLFAAMEDDMEETNASAEEADGEDYEDDEEDDEDEEDRPVVRRTRRPAPKGPDLRAIAEKLHLQQIGEKCAAAAGAVGTAAAHTAANFWDALKECKPGHMDAKQKRRFKNDVLPVLIGGAAALLCLVFIVGSVTRAIGAEERELAALEESKAQAELEAAAAAEIRNILNTASVQAAGYDYQAAINTLDSYKTAERELTEEMAAARTQYAAAMTDLVVWDDPAAIPNLSFHVLIEDSTRAYADADDADDYRKKFVTTDQFSEILKQLHENDFVLVNLESCIAENTGADGKTTYTTKPIYLPTGKTPIMITETLVNYFEYMTDGNGDGAPDAEGDGFASKLVISGGEIKAEYIDAEGQTHVGNYDLVPILDSFIDANPDFSYRGAKAILAVTGYQGIFGWRTDTDASLADGAADVVEVLRANGYQIACNSYANLDYSGSTSVAAINEDMALWKEKIAPITGDVDIMVIARGSAIGTNGGGFDAMEEAGFHYIIDCTGTAGGELTNEYFHQHRIMVTGQDLDTDIYGAYFNLNE